MYYCYNYKLFPISLHFNIFDLKKFFFLNLHLCKLTDSIVDNPAFNTVISSSLLFSYLSISLSLSFFVPFFFPFSLSLVRFANVYDANTRVYLTPWTTKEESSRVQARSSSLPLSSSFFFPLRSLFFFIFSHSTSSLRVTRWCKVPSHALKLIRSNH